ncbi:hypothetical protein SeMB42_g06729 [Synchytrium endobioticum]|nr:hypothetical protein SeMB42_g06729 [Synchytrium endobioticum]
MTRDISNRLETANSGGFATLSARAGGLLRVLRTLCKLKSNVKGSVSYQNSITVQASVDPTALQAQMKQLVDLNKVLFANVNFMLGFSENWRLFEDPCSSLRNEFPETMKHESEPDSATTLAAYANLCRYCVKEYANKHDISFKFLDEQFVIRLFAASMQIVIAVILPYDDMS